MQYRDIFENISSTLKRAKNIRALIAAPYTEDIMQSVATVYQKGYLHEVVLVGDPTRIPLSANTSSITDCFTVVEKVQPEDISLFVAQQGKCSGSLVVKGNISSSTLLKAVLRGGGKKIANHVYIIQSQSFPQKTVFVADAGVNIHPDVNVKASIINNVIDVAKTVGIKKTKVALISAVESINPSMQSTVDAAALKVMGEQGVFGDACVDGPMAFDAAMLESAAHAKGMSGPVAGNANVLILDNIEAANSTAKALIGVDGDAMGVIVGSGIPIAFPSRGDSEKTRYHSLLLAAFLSIH